MKNDESMLVKEFNINIAIVIFNFNVDLEDKYNRYRLHFF